MWLFLQKVTTSKLSNHVVYLKNFNTTISSLAAHRWLFLGWSWVVWRQKMMPSKQMGVHNWAWRVVSHQFADLGSSKIFYKEQQQQHETHHFIAYFLCAFSSGIIFLYLCMIVVCCCPLASVGAAKRNTISPHICHTIFHNFCYRSNSFLGHKLQRACQRRCVVLSAQCCGAARE